MELLQRCLILWVVLHQMSWNFIFSARVSCPEINFPNGKVKLRGKGRFANFRCKKGFERVGVKFAVCMDSGQWSQQLPVCVGTTCTKPAKVPNLVMQELYRGGVFKFVCGAGLTRSGPETIMCDGTNWNAEPPKCISGTSLECNFEEKGMCGWSHDVDDDFDWIWHQGETNTDNTGPQVDHTTNTSEGHYMFMESSAPQTSGQKTRLLSPAYSPADMIDMCLEFFYHMLGPDGPDEVGNLDVYVKPLTMRTTILTNDQRIFHQYGNQGDVWLKADAKIPQMSETFQIVLQATRLKSWTADIAIDDVKIRGCTDEIPSNGDIGDTGNGEKDSDDNVDEPAEESVPRKTTKSSITRALTTVYTTPKLTSTSPKIMFTSPSTSSIKVTSDTSPTTSSTLTQSTTGILSTTETSTPTTKLTIQTTMSLTTTSTTTTTPQKTTTSTTPTTTTTIKTTEPTTLPSTTTTTLQTTSIPTTTKASTTTTTELQKPTTSTTKSTTAPPATTTQEMTTQTSVSTTSRTSTPKATITIAPELTTTQFRRNAFATVTTIDIKNVPAITSTSQGRETSTEVPTSITADSGKEDNDNDAVNNNDDDDDDDYDILTTIPSNIDDGIGADNDDDDDNSDEDNTASSNNKKDAEDGASKFNPGDSSLNSSSALNTSLTHITDNETEGNQINEGKPSSSGDSTDEDHTNNDTKHGAVKSQDHKSSPTEMLPLIAGVASAVFVAAVVIAVLAYMWARNQRRKLEKDEEDQMNIITEYVETNLSV